MHAAAVEFALWEQNDIRELQDIESAHVAAYISALYRDLAPAPRRTFRPATSGCDPDAA